MKDATIIPTRRLRISVVPLRYSYSSIGVRCNFMGYEAARLRKKDRAAIVINQGTEREREREREREIRKTLVDSRAMRNYQRRDGWPLSRGNRV